MLALVFWPSAALAASATYTVACDGSNVVVGKHSASCSASPAVLRLLSFGTAKKPYPQGFGVTAVTVDCGRSSPVTPLINGPVVFKCHRGTPTLKSPQVLQSHSSPPPAGAPPAAAPAPAPSSCSQSSCDLITAYITPAINLFSILFSLVAVISLILGGIQYTTSEGDPQKASKAKNRIANTVFAILAYAMLYGFMQFLVPGGIFNR